MRLRREREQVGAGIQAAPSKPALAPGLGFPILGILREARARSAGPRETHVRRAPRAGDSTAGAPAGSLRPDVPGCGTKEVP